ncbi:MULTISPECIES: TetR/AcrR family transcriptional regulator [Stenotrophomonas]|uniref:TetR/AcrR family transcriptional regulator n=1 Tax=Stenotrophomonas TaxID=40323 RepID=UPI0027D30A87|nr:TetR/AcrR family transcriptional regulator [Stenotrophomonas maltophilia]MBN5024469.1 TetR/AcrR family transcriptional regulator [Stenotrophomonas maltophilia]WON67494.1 TetR/AcrR family transcriptional regulator [Stenotrophomonas maltophilia]HDS1100444.1 TetR/AcrR family transcriptional regulator [Stenotrophomonas maltophilia]HDS1106597.1 TetR/AcrR family transcriptional regulator [Stenotrophomonas maltophilia]HDS1110533.1 TetR/AcrR family transcriptional regulator [Stenotrophomonas maltop
MPPSTSPPPPRSRRKAPESVRQSLLQATVAMIGQHGLAALTVQDVARAAGVSKGALFHHFSSKQALVDEAIGGLIGEFEARVRALLPAESSGYGRFSRAYVQANFEHLLQQEQDNDIGLTLGNLLEPALLVRWRDWKRAMLVEFPDEADDPRLYAARCVADGYWATAYGRPLDALEHANALAMAEQALKLCDPL